MPSFDIVSEFDMHEASNAVDQANREVGTRFDFKGSGANFEQKEAVITLFADGDFQLTQMLDILRNKLTKRGIDISCMESGKVQTNGIKVKQEVTLKQGIETADAKKVVKKIKDSKIKVQAAIQGEKVRITGKKRDDLQQVIQLLRSEDMGMPLQFENMRD